MNEEIYRRLAEHLDRLPGGFPPSRTGAELRLLARLFTPQEAELAAQLTLERETAAAIAARTGLPLVGIQERLAGMARKGLIFGLQPPDGPAVYQAMPFVVGIYEAQLNDLTEGLRHDLDEYWSTTVERPAAKTIPQMRTIPVGKSIEFRPEALPYERVDDLIAGHTRFAVSPCICRRQARLAGHGCAAPEESCLTFGDWADYYVQTGRARAIDRAEALEILARADAANLVLQPSNSQDVAFICCCCGCCCGVLHDLKAHPRPAEIVVSAYVAQLDPEKCEGCWTCLERCQMGALREDGDRVALKAERCIGCGLCVTTCTSEALTLVRKPSTELAKVPPTLQEAWRTIAGQRARQL